MEDTILGRICNWAAQEGFFKMSEEQRSLLNDIDKLYLYFSEKLEGEAAEKFEKLCSSFGGVTAEEAESYFKMGFRLAFSLVAESFA